MITCEVEAVQPSTSPYLTLKVVLLVIHLLYGVIALIVFSCISWKLSMCICMISVYICLIYLYLLYYVARGKLYESCIYKRLRYFFMVSLKIVVAQVAVIVIFIKEAVERKESEDVNDLYVAITTSFVNCPWAFLMTYEFWCHKKERSNSVLIENGTAYFF